MFISTKVVLDIAAGTVLHREGFEYSGPLAECKGDSTLKDQEKSQAVFTQSLQKAFQTQFQNQQDLLQGFLNPKLKSIVDNPQGYSPEALAAARSKAIDENASSYQNAVKTTEAQVASRGGAALPSGVNAQIEGQLAGAAAGSKSSALENIDLQNEELKQNNRWRAFSALSGNASTANPLGYSESANQGSGVVGSLGTEYNQTQQNSFWSKLGDSFATQLGSTLAGGSSGGASGGVKGYFGG